MAERDFDEIREKLYYHEVPVEPNMWEEVQASMRKRRLRRAFYYTVSSAAAVALLFMLLVNPQRRMQEVELLAAVAGYEMNAAVSGGDVQQVQEEPAIQLEGEEPFIESAASAGGDDVQQVKIAGSKRKMKSAAAVEVRPAVKEDAPVSEQAAPDTEKVSAGKESGAVSYEAKSADAAWQGRVESALLDDGIWEEEVQPEGKRYAMAFSGGVMPGSSAGVNGPSIMATSSMSGSHGHIIEQVSDTKYMLPINLGVQLQFPVGENVALGVGVSYTMLKSKFDCLVNKVKYSGEQTLHYIGIPVNVYGTIAEKNRFMFYINAGAMLEKGIRAKYKFESYRDIHRHSTDMDGLLFSVNAGLGVEYKFSNYVGLYFEPNLIYFTNSDMQYSVRTDQPLQIKAELGCRFHF